MDSGNSGSLQSSSGGDDDYDYTGPTSGAATSVHAPQPPAPPSSSSLFDTLTYFESSFPRSPPPPPSNTTNPFLNLESPWPRHLRPPFNPNCTTDIAGLITPSASSSTATTTAVQPPPDAPPPRVSKKRSRASRRAPTTVLTTDTTNFRAMVQEFTGIPTSPFSCATSSSPFPRSRLPRYQDSPYNLLRPFAHKPHGAAAATSFPGPFPSSSSTSLVLDHPPATTNNATHHVTTAASSSTNQVAHDHHHLISSVSMQNQALNFQSLLQPPNPITNLPSFMTTTTATKSHLQVNYGHHVSRDQIGQVSAANLSGNLSSLVGSAEGMMHSGCSEFHPEKGSSDGGRPPRSEGMVDSWICSSE